MGLKGTVIGITRQSTDSTEFMHDILFDSAFEGGLELNCSKGRGYKLPLNAFINISHGIRKYQKKQGLYKISIIFHYNSKNIFLYGYMYISVSRKRKLNEILLNDLFQKAHLHEMEYPKRKISEKAKTTKETTLTKTLRIQLLQNSVVIPNIPKTTMRSHL